MDELGVIRVTVVDMSRILGKFRAFQADYVQVVGPISGRIRVK